MRVFYAIFDSATGDYKWGGQCDDTVLKDQAQAGEYVIQTDTNPVTVTSVNLQPVIDSLCNKVDREAGEFRSKFITVGAGQEMTYVFKTAEAKAWSTDADQSLFPFLTAEAVATGVSTSSVRDLVLSTAAQFIFLGSRIEGARLGAKQAIKAAANVNAMMTAADVDWVLVTTPTI